MVEAERGHQRSFIPTSLFKHSYLEHATQDFIKMVLEHLQGRRLHKKYWQKLSTIKSSTHSNVSVYIKQGNIHTELMFLLLGRISVMLNWIWSNLNKKNSHWKRDLPYFFSSLSCLSCLLRFRANGLVILNVWEVLCISARNAGTLELKGKCNGFQNFQWHGKCWTQLFHSIPFNSTWFDMIPFNF